jgi:hypothetical protein
MVLLFKVLACLTVVLGAIACLYIYQKLEARRIRRQEAFAETIGMTYLGGDEKMYTLYCGFRLLLNRRNVSMYNLFRAETDDLQISIFETNYQTGKKYSQNKGRYIDQTVVAVKASKFEFPSFKIEADNILAEQCRDFFAPDFDDVGLSPESYCALIPVFQNTATDHPLPAFASNGDWESLLFHGTA